MNDRDLLDSISAHTGSMKSLAWLHNIQVNQDTIGFHNDISLFRNAHQNQKAVVIAAGPGFRRFGMKDLSLLREHSEVTKISCDGALPMLAEANIIPQYVTSVDCHPVCANFYRRFFEKIPYNAEGAMNAFLSTTVHRDVVQILLDHGVNIYWWQAFRKETAPDRKRQLGFDPSKLYVDGIMSLATGGNVGTTCFIIASQLLKSSPIGLLGIEFAWSDETPYASTQYYDELMKLVDGDPERLHAHFKRVKNHRDGKTYIADPVYYCFSEDTRALTKKGFKSYSEITYDDEIATVSETGVLEYQKPSSIHIYPSYEGDMFLFEGEQVSLLVTPNHRMHLMVNGKPELLEAQELAIRRSNMKIGCKSEGLTHARLLKELDWKGCDSEVIEIPQVKYGGHPGQNLVGAIRTEVFVKFLGWYLAEGSLASNGRGPQYQICLGAQERWLSDYADALNNMGIRWQRVQYTNVPGIRFNSKQIYTYLLPLGKSGTKYIPEEIKQLSPHYLKILLSTLIDGDGTINSNGVTQYITMSKRLAEDVSEIAIKCGYWARIGRCKSGIYFVTIPSEKRGIMMPNPRKVPYKGVVWCVSVPNGTLIVERKGRIAISGNSYYLAFKEIWRNLEYKTRKSTFNLTEQGILSAKGLETITTKEFLNL